MMKIRLYSLLVLIIALYNQSCTYHNEESFFPELGKCDTLDVSYSNDIVPVLEVNCFSCHSSENAPLISGINLEDHSNLTNYAKNGKLIGVIKHEQGLIPMPPSGNMIDDCSINKIEAWINQGSKNN
jgi:hypothetical protein